MPHLDGDGLAIDDGRGMTRIEKTGDPALCQSSEPAPEETFKKQFKEVWTRDRFTGDWEGWRTELLNHGIDAQFRLSR